MAPECPACEGLTFWRRDSGAQTTPSVTATS